MSIYNNDKDQNVTMWDNLQNTEIPEDIMVCDNGREVEYSLNNRSYNAQIQKDDNGYYFRWWGNDSHKQQIFYLDSVDSMAVHL